MRSSSSAPFRVSMKWDRTTTWPAAMASATRGAPHDWTISLVRSQFSIRPILQRTEPCHDTKNTAQTDNPQQRLLSDPAQHMPGRSRGSHPDRKSAVQGKGEEEQEK